ncbi:MAG: DUF4386 domain-containing protein [Fimbriimonadaceae bacterium]|nr:DUF4386 domain-containing protein [Fimbriimonadaceae bacterium]
MPPKETANSASTNMARIAGIGYLVIILCGLFAEFGVRQALFAPGDAFVTARNIRAHEFQFRLGIASDLVMLLADVVVAWALFFYLKTIDRTLSLLAGLLRLVQASVIGASLVNLTAVLNMLDSNELADYVVRLTVAHAGGYRIGLVFFGACCGVIAALIARSGWIPRWIGVLMGFAAAGYLIDSFGPILSPSYPPDLSNIVLIPAFVAEVSFCIWLIAVGGRISAQKGVEREPESVSRSMD